MHTIIISFLRHVKQVQAFFLVPAQLYRANLCLHETSPGGVCLGIQQDQNKPLITLRKHIPIQEEFVLNFLPSV